MKPSTPATLALGVPMPSIPLPRGWARLLLVAALAATAWAATTSRHIAAADVFSDKLLHAVAFAGLAALAHSAFPLRGQFALSLMGLLGYGFAIELVQSRLPYRSYELFDLLADAVGLGAYVVASAVLGRLMTTR